MARHEDVTKRIEFEHAKMNFVAAARQGTSAHLMWFDRKEMTAPALILEHLLPLAAEGLDKAGVRPGDRDRYLGVIERRVSSAHTGSRWLLLSLAAMKDHGTQAERLNALTSATVARQSSGAPRPSGRSPA
jgi:hypothetical protein